MTSIVFKNVKKCVIQNKLWFSTSFILKPPLRSVLYLPGDRNKFFDGHIIIYPMYIPFNNLFKLCYIYLGISSLKCDHFIIDLEDAVSQKNKKGARETVKTFLLGLKMDFRKYF